MFNAHNLGNRATNDDDLKEAIQETMEDVKEKFEENVGEIKEKVGEMCVTTKIFEQCNMRNL